MKKFILIQFIFTIIIGYSQFNDNFNTLNTDIWKGDTSFYEISNNILHLNAPAVSASAYLSTSLNSYSDASWEFYFRLDATTSSSNKATVYLSADNTVLNDASQGYYVIIGDTDDEVSLYRKDISGSEKIIDGINKSIDNNPVEIKIKASRDNNGNWKLWLNDILQGSVTDSTYPIKGHFGFISQYTSTRSTLFYYDSLTINGTVIVDNSPAQIQSISFVNSDTSLICFNEEIIKDSLIISINNLQIINTSHHCFYFISNDFIQDTDINLVINNIQDLSNNQSDTSLQFTFRVPQEGDILITEIFFDPSPSILLPDAEFVELYNNTNQSISLHNWEFSSSTSIMNFDNISIDAGEYITITHQDNIGLFSQYGKLIGSSSFPSLANDGTQLSLSTDKNTVIHQVTYDNSFYNHPDKEHGGWSIEMINPNYYNCGSENWEVSSSHTGGTPSQINSVLNDNKKPDLITPIITAYPISADSILLRTNSSYLEISINSIGINNLNSSTPNTNIILRERQYAWHLSNPMNSTSIYEIAGSQLRTCTGELFSFNIPIALAHPVSTGDILLNEILFNPSTGNNDFVEIVNTSNHPISTASIKIAATDDQGNTLQVFDIPNTILFPSEYYVITKDANQLKQRYPNTKTTQIIEASLPSYNDDDGIFVLIDTFGHKLEQFNYNKDMHFQLLKNDEDVSLERISLNSPTQLTDNWFSASQSSGGATPTQANSQRHNISKSDFLIEPKIFSPDQDGVDDLLHISYTAKSGEILNASIYNHRGVLIRNLSQNEQLSTQGVITWDGVDDKNQLATIGIYILVWETFNESGEQHKSKKSFVIGGKL